MFLRIPILSKVEKQNVVLTKIEEIYIMFFRINKLETFEKMNKLVTQERVTRRQQSLSGQTYARVVFFIELKGLM